jgi:catechol 2,3-dioxygenase-like lactoylglutathione lyase family enzyme
MPATVRRRVPSAGRLIWINAVHAAWCGTKQRPFQEIVMSPSVHPVLAHCGIYVRDVDKQVDFYKRVLGFVVADRGTSERLGFELAFLTAATDHHHQVVFISGRAPSGVTTVNQLSFKVADLEQLKEMYRRAREAGVTDIRQVNHGNALSFYMSDPELYVRSRGQWH